MHIHIPLAIACIAVLAGCASPTTKRVDVTSQQTNAEARKQMDLLVEDLVSERTRLHRVHWKLASNSADLCPKRIHASGVEPAIIGQGCGFRDAGTDLEAPAKRHERVGPGIEDEGFARNNILPAG